MKKIKKLSLKKIKIASIEYSNRIKGGNPIDNTVVPILTYFDDCGNPGGEEEPGGGSNNTCNGCNASGGFNGDEIDGIGMCVTTVGNSDTCFSLGCI